MKSIILAATLACVLVASSASSDNISENKVHKVQSEVTSYVRDNMGNIRMMKGSSAHLECYNGFLPLIDSLASKARDDSYGCVMKANAKKQMILYGLDEARSAVAVDIGNIVKSLNGCSKQDGLNYFNCLEQNAEANRQLMENIKNKSKSVMADYEKSVAEIDRAEETCLMDAIDNAKYATDQAYDDLRTCIKDGPVIQAQINKEESTTEVSNSSSSGY